MYRPALPEGYIIDSIHSSDVEFVVSKWGLAKNSPKMKQLLRHFIANHPNAVIYDTSTEPPRPVSWNLSLGLGILFHLFTDEEHRRKGLAFMVITEMIHKILAKGITPVAYVYIDNIKGQRFFDFSGYTNTGSLVVHEKF